MDVSCHARIVTRLHHLLTPILLCFDVVVEVFTDLYSFEDDFYSFEDDFVRAR